MHSKLSALFIKEHINDNVNIFPRNAYAQKNVHVNKFTMVGEQITGN